MWNIGNIQIESHVVLAPMAGITSLGYREFMHQFGVGANVTEMVSDMGLIYGNKETSEYIAFSSDCYPTGVQLFGHDPVCLAKAAKIALEANPDIAYFDVNMGCPVPKVVKTGAGSCLMQTPKLCGDIVRAIKEASGLPVTAKIRLGWDEKSINYLEVIKELENAGVAAIGIHARTRKECYSGLPHWDMLKGLRKQMNVPLIVSGNIYTLEDAISAIEITGADAVMVARGGMGNPYLITQIDHYYKTGEKLEGPSVKEQIDWCQELGDYLIKEKGEGKAMRLYRGIASKFFSGFPNAKAIKNRLSTELNTREDLEKILIDVKQQLEL